MSRERSSLAHYLPSAATVSCCRCAFRQRVCPFYIRCDYTAVSNQCARSGRRLCTHVRCQYGWMLKLPCPDPAPRHSRTMSYHYQRHHHRRLTAHRQSAHIRACSRCGGCLSILYVTLTGYKCGVLKGLVHSNVLHLCTGVHPAAFRPAPPIRKHM